MTTKFKKIYNPIALLAFFSVLTVSCNKEDNTGYSTLSPTTPTITVTAGFTSPASLVESDSTLEYTITLSEAQLVDVKLNVSQVGGTATSDDYELSSEISIVAGATTAKGKIKILSDELIEETETLTLQIGDNETANATFTPVTFEFNILNVTSEDLVLEMSWGGDIYDVAGKIINPTSLADMILLITDADGTILDVADGGSFETFVIGGADFPDGEYFVIADYYAVMDLGQMGYFYQDVTLDYSQLGVQKSSITFENSLYSGFSSCDYRTFTIAKITKTGTSYVVEPVGENQFVIDPYLTTFSCNEPGYGDYVVSFSQGQCQNMIICDNFWDGGFEIQYELDSENDSVFITEDQEIRANIGRGPEQLKVEGKGTYNPETYEMVVDYTVITVADTLLIDDNTHTFTKP